ncbi:MAG: hypothetical protein M1824_004358 [Vezdaea acicularis]|nr:MAG: hypothetical protein M1824_004358 [Vezdaea acicularis]
MSGAGHFMGYATSTFDLSKVFGKSLGVLRDNEANLGIWGVFSTIFEKARHLPTRIADALISLNKAQSNLPVYGSTWVGETYYRQSAQTAAELTKSSDVLGDIARKGSSALVLFTLMSFIGSIVLPMIVDSPTHDSSPASRKRLLSVNNDTLTKYLPNLTTAWGLSQILFSASLILAPFSHSFRFATSIITLCGIPWAMTGWAPLAIMGVEINTLSSTTSARHAYTRLSIDDSRPTMELTTQNHTSSNHSSHHASRNPSPHDDYEPYLQPTDEPYSPPSEVAGIYLGILNIFCTIPQFLGTFISMVAFSILEPGKSPELGGGEVKKVLGGLSGTAVCLAIGAVCSGVAALRIFRMRKA